MLGKLRKCFARFIHRSLLIARNEPSTCRATVVDAAIENELDVSIHVVATAWSFIDIAVQHTTHLCPASEANWANNDDGAALSKEHA
jgi:hypothetical protein